jgi:hypothetical protein
MPHLLVPIVPREKLHPSFAPLVSDRRRRSTRLLLQDAWKRMPIRDLNFIRDFQTTEFDSRTFELFTSELLHEAGATFTIGGEQPDFEPTIGTTSFALECATINPTKDGGPAPVYKATNQRDRDMDDLRHRVMHDVPVRVGGALRSKQLKRFQPGDRPYWELDNVRGKPFIYAMQTFHEDGALAFSSSAVATYLYGTLHTPEWDEHGKLIIRQSTVRTHVKDTGVEIDSGFFKQAQNAHVSGVLWCNAGTIAKFGRMALQGPYPDPDVHAFRVGNAVDHDPNAHAPATFIYEVGDPNWLETWGEGCTLFHNPNAVNPLPLRAIPNVADGYIDDQGRYVESIPPGMHPFMSLSFFALGDCEAESAAEHAASLYEVLNATNRQTAETKASKWWEGFDAAGDGHAYKSEGFGD